MAGVRVGGAIDSARPTSRTSSTPFSLRACFELRQSGLVPRAVATTSLPVSRVRHPAPRAEVVEPLAPFHAEPRFQRIRRIVQAGVDDAAVVRARFHAGPPVAIEDGDIAVVAGRGRGGRKPHHPAADTRTSSTSMSVIA